MKNNLFTPTGETIVPDEDGTLPNDFCPAEDKKTMEEQIVELQISQSISRGKARRLIASSLRKAARKNR